MTTFLSVTELHQLLRMVEQRLELVHYCASPRTSLACCCEDD